MHTKTTQQLWLGARIHSLFFLLFARMGILSIVLLIVLGIVGFLDHVVFSVVGWVIAIILVFVEVPLTLRVLPRTRAVNSMLLFYEHCILRSIMYLVFSVVMFLSNILNGPTPLIAPAVALILTCLCYLAAGMLGQPFASSRVLGGTMDRIV
ncbi:hypothetical protein BC940DRAFT_4618 [Gongronella butleri]|nr:hypothetical protein BC940DRAFT_4618 [Gongronella butleri]